MTKIHESDLKFVPVDADLDFSPEHNRKVIEETIRKSEANARKKQREFNEGLGERAEAARRFIKSKVNSSAQRYFGKRELARLRGLEVIDMLKKRLN